MRNLDILNRVQIPRLDGIQQMLITYPDAVTGGFTVVRRDEDGVLRSHFGFVLNAGDPHSCTTGYVASETTPSQGAVENVDTDAVRCRVVNGVDPDPGRRLRRERLQHPRRRRTSAGAAAGAPRSRRSSCRAAARRRSTTALSELLGGLLHANPIATLTG